MRLGARGKLFLVSLLLLDVSVVGSEIYLVPSVERDLTTRIEQDMRVRLQLVAARASDAIVGTSAQVGNTPESGPALREAGHAASAPSGYRVDWEEIARELGRAAEARVTFIRADGIVLGDSEVGPGDLAGLENHRTRPEVAGALTGQTTDSIRYSSTIGKRMLYAATPVPGHAEIVARLSLPLAWVDTAKSRVRSLVVGSAIVALLGALVAAFAVAELMSRRLRKLTGVARRMAAGDLEVRTCVETSDEIGELGGTLDHLASNLSRSLRELRADRDLLGRILESMREGVLVMDGEHRILLANPCLREMMLLDSDVVGRSTIEVIRNAELQNIVERALSSGTSAMGEIEIGGLKPRRLLVHASRLTGEPRALLLVLFDVTEMRRLETVRRDFVANVSHELRTPVASMRSATETLRMAMGHDEKATEQFLDIIERNGRRLGELIADLLDLSRIEAKEFRLRIEPLDLADLIQQTVAASSERASTRHIGIAVAVPRDCPRPTGDRHAFDRVLANLVDNAIKYCPEHSAIQVAAQPKPGCVLVTISDNGHGIDARHLPRLFERFYRADPGRSREMGGTGLGLSIVKHLVEAMGGEVTVESTPGKGSTFGFTLPLSREPSMG
ncbi:MAG: ATP-binding protein [Polyangia bacterium]|jgi:two-component system phosphate regulon sensor histidine kinase PhoR